MTEADTYQCLTGIFREVFERNDIVATPTLVARDVVGWDSFKQVEILLAIEEETGIRFTSGEAQNLGSVGDIARIMLSRSPTQAA